MTGFFCLVAACGCSILPISGSAGDDLPVAVLYSGQICPCKLDRPELSWLDEERKLAHFMRQAGQHRLESAGDPDVKIDFATHRALAIVMGRTPTAGYSLSLASEAARLRGDTLEIKVQRHEPPKDAWVAQMLTSPCLVVRLPAGDYTRVTVKDQTDSTWASLDLP